MKTITINDVCFELQNSTATMPSTERYKMRTIWDCYKKPSKIKVVMYELWERYAKEIGAQGFTVASYNTNMFTIEFYFTYDGVKYLAYITRAHNRLYRIAE